MPRCARVFIFTVAVLACGVFACAQQAAGPVPDSGSPRVGSVDLIVNLLQQSHDLNKQFPVQTQGSLLQQQARLAAEVQPELGRQWANELFLLSAQMKQGEQAFAQDSAMAILARLDPDHALELLHTMALNDSDSQASAPFQPHSQLVRQVFQALVGRDGEAALPAIEREANFMAATGVYPYSAVGMAVSNAVSKDWRQDKEHAVQVEQAAFDLMYARYSSTAHTYFGDIEFGQMLKLFSASLPIESIKPALHLLVSNLLATDTSKYQYRAEVFTSDGRNAKADNAIDAALMWNGQVINRDPDLAQQLESTRPELRDGLEYSKPGVARGGSFGGRAGPPKPHTVDPAQEAERDAIRLAHMNPDLAISKAESLPAGPQRARTLLEVARSIAGGDPDRAMQLAAEVSTASQAGDQQTQLDLLSVKAFVAAAQHDQSGLRNLLQSGFDAAASLISGSPRPLVPGVANLVQIGIQNDPDVTLAFFQTIPPSQIKARLLLDAAEALNMHQRLPFPSRPRVKEAQAQQ